MAAAIAGAGPWTTGPVVVAAGISFVALAPAPAWHLILGIRSSAVSIFVIVMAAVVVAPPTRCISPRRSRSRSRLRLLLRGEMHRGRRDDDRGHDYHEDRDRRRPDARDRMPARLGLGPQREERDRRGDDD